MSGGSVRFWFSCELGSWPVLRIREAADVADALRDVLHRPFPVALVFDGDVAIEFLPSQFAQNAFHVGDAQAERQVGRIGVAGLNDVLQMHANHAPLENLEAS